MGFLFPFDALDFSELKGEEETNGEIPVSVQPEE